MIIREVTLSDAYGIARVHVDSWRSTYKVMVSSKFLNGLSYDDRTVRWKNVINDLERENKYIYVAEDTKDGIIGYAMCGIERESKDPNIGELYGIYIIEEHQNKGVGSLLFSEVSNKLMEFKFTVLMIWVLVENYQARRFYELMGGIAVKEKDIVIAGDTLREIAYEFKIMFNFKDSDYLTDGVIDLLIEEKVPANEEKSYVPAYKYRITLHNDSERIGNIDIRIGDKEGLYYGGHIGYEIDESHRGNGYASKACKIIKQVAVAHGMDILVITCNPDNYPSRRTCEKVGLKLKQIVDLPTNNEMYLEGERQKCQYEWNLKED